MPRYRFTEDQIYQAGNQPRYLAGETYSLDQDFGERWVRRGVASPVRGDGPALPDPRFPDLVAAYEKEKADKLAAEKAAAVAKADADRQAEIAAKKKAEAEAAEKAAAERKPVAKPAAGR